jgi:hypothetical protein
VSGGIWGRRGLEASGLMVTNARKINAATGFIYFMFMQIIHFPDQQSVQTSMANDDPLLMLVSFDGERLILSNIDDSLEHHILLKNAGFSENDLNSYFRLIVNKSGASWTYVCPSSYLNIRDRELRLKKYYENGIDEITKALKLIGYDVPIDIPQRYRRHFDALENGGK